MDLRAVLDVMTEEKSQTSIFVFNPGSSKDCRYFVQKYSVSLLQFFASRTEYAYSNLTILLYWTPHYLFSVPFIVVVIGNETLEVIRAAAVKSNQIR
jgi:hypothetical protein